MLHVKHRYVLVNRDLEPFRRCGLQQRLELCDVQIIRGRDTLQAVTIDEVLGAERVGDIEREIADPPAACNELQMVVIANQVAVRFA